jgi:hypothetical protein
MSEEKDDQKAFKLVLDELKQKEKENRPLSLRNIILTFRDLKSQGRDPYKDIELEDVAETLENLYLDGWFRLDWEQHDPQWLRLSSYGKSQLELDYHPVFLDPIETIKEIKDSIPNIDSIAIEYFTEALYSIRKRLYLAATVTMGCASERSILLLIETIIEYYKDDSELNSQFSKCISIKRKFDLLIETIKEKNLKSDLLLKYKADKNEIDAINKLFVDIDTHLEQMFSIYRTNRNEAGHPTGRKFSEEIVKAQAAMFKKYCEVIYGLISYLSEQ